MTEIELDDFPLTKKFLQETGMDINSAYIFFKNKEKKEQTV